MEGFTQSDQTFQHFKLEVDPERDEGTGYDAISNVWEGDLFRLELHADLKDILPSKGMRTFLYKQFDEMTPNDVLSWAHKHGYRPCLPFERDAFVSKAYLHRWSPFVDLGSFCEGYRGRMYPYVHYNDGARYCCGSGDLELAYRWERSLGPTADRTYDRCFSVLLVCK